MLNIWQIHFDQQTKRNCYPEWNHYDNSEKLTEHFENSVIVDLYNKGEIDKADYFGVFSHDCKKDLVFKEDGLVFDPQNLEKVVVASPEVDFFSFQKRRQQKNIVLQAENYHPGFVDMINTILKETGFLDKLPKFLNHIVLFNYFVAKKDIYKQYVEELLIPAMKVLEEMPAAYNDARYKRVDEVTQERFIKAFGRPYWVYHPFLLERLPSIFLQKYKLNVKQIF